MKSSRKSRQHPTASKPKPARRPRSAAVAELAPQPGPQPAPVRSIRSRIVPPLLGVLAAGTVMLALNGQWLTAQMQYRFAQPQPAYAEAASSLNLDPNATPELTIPALNIKAPVIFEPSYKEADVQLALRKGVVKFPTTADPGQPGNVVIFGHSSGQPWAPGEYKFVFTLLDKLKPGDKVYVDHKGQRYIYQMRSSEVVLPEQVGVLNATDVPTLTLITCTPVGTSQKRLVVRAEQISPKPAAQAAATQTADAVQPVQPPALPDGAQTSLWQSVRDLF